MKIRIIDVPPGEAPEEVRKAWVGWRLIDCSFGLFGVLPLLYSLRLTKSLENKMG